MTAKRRCPDLIFVPPRCDVYRAVSAQIGEIFAEHTDLIEPLSLDEAYLDVTENKQNILIATDITTMIRAHIKDVTDLNASAGISYCKFLAKTASDLNKPNGQAVIPPKAEPDVVAGLAVKKFHGVGPATAAKMERLGILTGADLRTKPLAYLHQHFGKSGAWYYNIARGIDDRSVQPDRPRKSVGAEDTFATDIHDLATACTELIPLAEKVWRYCDGKGLLGKTVTLKVKFADFQQITRSRTTAAPVSGASELNEIGASLLSAIFPVEKGIRLLGITVSNFHETEPDAAEQLRLEI